VTSKLANGTANQILIANGTTVAPSWVTGSLSGLCVNFGCNVTATTGLTYYQYNGIYGSTSPGTATSNSSRFYCPIGGTILNFTRLTQTASTSGIISIYKNGVSAFASVAGNLSTAGYSNITGGNVSVALGDFIEVVSSGTIAIGSVIVCLYIQ
jgi:hypothetical protein